MQLIRARVKNFRSLRNVTVEFESHTALIGSNGTGKSSILKAVERFYSTSARLDPDDYFGRDQNTPVEIELTFGKLTQNEQEAFASRVRDGKLVVTRIFDGTASSGRYHGAVMQNPDFVPIRAQTQAGPKRDAYRALRNDNPDYASLPAASSAAAAEEAMAEWETDHPEQLSLQLDDGQFFGFQNASRGALQRHTSFVFVPAVRDASVDAADGKTSVIGRLVELLVRSSILQREEFQAFKQEMTTRYQALVAAENMPELGALATTLTTDLKGLYQDAEVGLSWREVADFPVPLPVADVTLSDQGFGGPVDRQGHGLQRAFIFTLLQHLARTASSEGDEDVADGEAPEPQVPNLILAIEEPELYQHPTKQRHFAEVLRGLSSGSLPGATAPTQIAFATHSPLFVSLGHSDEIRLVRRIDCEDADLKQCDLKALNLDEIAKVLENGWCKPEGSYSGATLVPRLHILGPELAEGFFANGVVLVEGRSDKAAIAAASRLLGLNFGAAGIAVLSAEGKDNLDRPLVIFRELGIPTFVVWDCDSHKEGNGARPATNLALARLCGEDIAESPVDTHVGSSFAHFGETLERTLKAEVGEANLANYLADACAPFGIPPSNESQKIPEVMYRTLLKAEEEGADFPTLKGIVAAAWAHLVEDVSTASLEEAETAA